jgi:hypothetical protein
MDTMKLIREEGSSHHRAIVDIALAGSPCTGLLALRFENQGVGKP